MSSELERGKNRRPATRQSTRRPSPGSGSVQFVNRELTAEEKVAQRAWRNDGEAVLALMDEACDDGYKFSLKYDDYSSSYACFLFPSDDSDNGSLCLTGRGGTVYRAIAEALYKHVVIFRKVWVISGGPGYGVDDPDF